MSEAFYTTASGAVVQNLHLEVLANNLANINSTGYKQDRALFTSYIPRNYDYKKDTDKIELHTYQNVLPSTYHVSFERTEVDFAQGPKKHTGNPFDLAIDGNGFFTVNTPKGIRYTRNGSFTLNQAGELVSKEGFPVQGESGSITIGGDSFEIDKQGNVAVNGSRAGTLKIVSFDESIKLEKDGKSMFVLPEGSEAEEIENDMEIKQGFIELSNVDAVRTMTEMITALRSYESHLKALRSMDEVTSKAIEGVGKTV